MAQRTRHNDIRYGGRFCGILNGSTRTMDAFIGRHTLIDETHPGPPYRTGGPLLVKKKKVYIHSTESYEAHYNPVPHQDWKGYLYVRPYIPSPEPSQLDISGWGAYGWNKAHPLHPIYSLGVSLAELKELPSMLKNTWEGMNKLRGLPFTGKPKTIRDFLNDSRKGAVQAGGDYLNLQFGWVPFVQDVVFLINMKRKLENKILWLRSVNGKSIRRRFELNFTENSVDIARTVVPQATVSPVLPTQLYSGSVVTSYPFPILKSYRRRIWFSSKWRVAMPELDDLQDNLTTLKLDLLGLSLDPSIIYRLIPWSWLLDWFSSVGSAISNIYLRSQHGVVAEYAYVMCRETYRYDAPGQVNCNVGNRAFPSGVWSQGQRKMGGVSHTIYEFRQREVANPFGFGVKYASLTEYQWSILVALGLSRGGKHYAPRS